MPSFFHYPELRERLIVLEGWSKAYSMTGWRLGWSFWPKNLVEHVNKLVINSVRWMEQSLLYDWLENGLECMAREFNLACY